MFEANRPPAEVYNRIEFDARVSGAGKEELVLVLIEQLLIALQSAIFAHENRLNERKSAAMTRAIAALTALELGVVSSSENDMGASLLTFYRETKKAILDSVVKFDADAFASIYADFSEIRQALAQAGKPGRA
jgi:flagellar protein FliS